MLFNKVLLETMRFATYRDKQSEFKDSFLMTSCSLIKQKTDLIKYSSRLWRAVSEEGVHLCVTLG